MTPTAYAGYYRPSKRAAWTLLAEADTYDDAWGLLLDRLPSGPGGESVVLAAGTSPSGKVSEERSPLVY
jgi:hypothetical protein